jgi:GT2 family glycosyltransferase
MKTSIIIPSYNGKEMLIDCIQSIRDYTDLPYEIIVVDNGSNDGTVDFCLKEKITFISISENRGSPFACNLGMRISSGDTLLLLNNDIVVSHNWLSNQLACLYSSEEIGIVGPYSNYASGKQMLPSSYDNIQQFHDEALKRNQPDSQLWQPIEKIVGSMCFLIKRKLFEKIGQLDEQFSQGHYEDDDYCYRARQAGYKLMLAGDVMIHHYDSPSFHQQDPIKLQELIDRNLNKFISKWGVDPQNLYKTASYERESND